MKTTYNIVLIIFLTSIIFWNTGCRKYPFLEGNGSVTSETRTTVSFNKIDNQGDFNVYYIHDTVFRVIVEAESNLIPHIRTVVNGNTLEIDTRENLNNNYAMKVVVYSPVLDAVTLSGSGLINTGLVHTDNFVVKLSGSGDIYGDANTDYFETVISGSGGIDFVVNSVNTKAVISGSGNIKLSGESTYADYLISGSGNIESYNLLLNECTAKISGSGNIYTNVSDYLNVKISGSGDLYYIGNPIIDVDISGSGNVIHGK